MADFLNQLYSPVGSQQGAGNVWGGGGFTPGAQQAASYFGAQSGAGAPNMPIGAGTTMYDPMQQEDIRNVGITNTDQNALETYIPEAADPLEEQTNMFSDAYTKGYTATQDVSGTGGYGDVGVKIWALGGTGITSHKKGDTGEAGTMQAARMAKRDDRESDQEVYQKAQKDIKADLIAGGAKKGQARRQARRAKRQLRRGMRRTRKDAWKSFKGDQKLERQQDAYDYEQKYT
jgi:hypothetical protein